MKNLFIKIFIISFFFVLVHIHASDIKFGAAVKNITPNPLLPVSGGVGIPKEANILKGKLTTRAFVITNGETKLAIVSIDNLGVPKIIGDRIRKLVPEIKAENIVIGATHTHSAPDLYGFADENGNTGVDQKYINLVVEQTAAAINEALNNLKLSNVKINVDEAKGKIAYNYYAPKLYDPRCGVIQFIDDENQNILGTLVNYAIHPEVIGSDRGICTPDLIGPMCDKIESETGGIALFMNSAQGGMVTADNRLDNGKEANDWDECNRIGDLLASEALRIISTAEIQENPKLENFSKVVNLPVETELMKFILKHAVLDYQISEDGTTATQMNLINFGSAQIITIPGEALPNIGFYIKRKMNTNNPFLFGLTNDAYGYILTKEDYNSFKTYNYITRTSLGENTGQIIIDSALDLIKNHTFNE